MLKFTSHLLWWLGIFQKKKLFSVKTCNKCSTLIVINIGQNLMTRCHHDLEQVTLLLCHSIHSTFEMGMILEAQPVPHDAMR